VEEGRAALHADEERHTFTRRNEEGDLVEETVRLRDWFLPALYQQASDPKGRGLHEIGNDNRNPAPLWCDIQLTKLSKELCGNPARTITACAKKTISVRSRNTF
jgi:hypothetical protein